MKCNICNANNKENEHYCVNCGKNLSAQLEKTAFLFGVSSIIKWLSILSFLLICPGLFLIESITGALTFNGKAYGSITLFLVIINVVMLIIGSFIKIYALELCKKI